MRQVRIYTGSPDATREPQSYSAHTKQRNEWERLGATVITRTLRYPVDWPASKAEQKGVDVALAIDFVAMGLDGLYEVGIIASTYTDLKPAIEYVKRKCAGHCIPEVVAWKSPKSKSRLYLPQLWCNWLDSNDYDQVADLTDYNK